VRPLFGIETEYAIAGFAEDGSRVPQAELLGRLMQTAWQVLQCVHAAEGGLFLTNGARLYVDHGGHPEYATPECTDPWDVVRHVLAGEQILRQLASRLVGSGCGIDRIVLLKTNVDYSDSSVTWGCHESFLHRGEAQVLHDQLLPHLVSRIVYTGAGGFDPSANSVRFLLSPRSVHLRHVSSEHSVRERGICHRKNEPHASGYGRLHLLCGESLCSQRAMLLRTGTTALIVALADGGIAPGSKVKLTDPLGALRAFAADTRLVGHARGVDGRMLRAVDIQRHYLEMALRHVDAAFMPSWTSDICSQWGAVLDALEGGDESLARSLDWRIKLAVFDRRLEECEGTSGDSTAGDGALGDGPWSQLREADMRFGQLVPTSVFESLGASGVLDHAVVTQESIVAAMKSPPAGSRAVLRGEAVSSLARSSKAVCHWTYLLDPQKGKLSLDNPFASEARWVASEATEGAGGPLGSRPF